MDIHQFFLGNAFDAHTYFGAHVTEQGVVFRTLAPNAAAVDLIWDTHAADPRRRRVRAHRTGSRRRTDVQVPHHPAESRRRHHRPLRPLWLRHGAASEQRFDYPRPVQLHVPRQEMAGTAWQSPEETGQHLRGASGFVANQSEQPQRLVHL